MSDLNESQFMATFVGALREIAARHEDIRYRFNITSDKMVLVLTAEEVIDRPSAAAEIEDLVALTVEMMKRDLAVARCPGHRWMAVGGTKEAFCLCGADRRDFIGGSRSL